MHAEVTANDSYKVHTVRREGAFCRGRQDRNTWHTRTKDQRTIYHNRQDGQEPFGQEPLMLVLAIEARKARMESGHTKLRHTRGRTVVDDVRLPGGQLTLEIMARNNLWKFRMERTRNHTHTHIWGEERREHVSKRCRSTNTHIQRKREREERREHV